jgi:hypothetical protein
MEQMRVLPFWLKKNSAEAAVYFSPSKWREGRGGTVWEHLTHVEEIGKEQYVNQRLYGPRDGPPSLPAPDQINTVAKES